MISTQEIKVQALNPSMPLNPFTAFKSSPSSLRVLDVPKKIGLWNITSVQIQVTYPDSHIVSKECVRTGNVWVGTLEGTSAVGSVCKGYHITASGVDEDGNEVSGYVLGAGDVVIMELDGSIYPSESADYIRIFDKQPTNPKKGDAYLDGVALMVYDGNAWTKVGGQDVVPDPNNKGWALNATNANTASYASQATNSENSDYATYALRAGHDNNGNAFSQTYVTKVEIVPDTSNSGYAMNASYAMNSVMAQTSQHASLATKAEQDGNGNNIATTYAKKDELKNSKVTITQGGVEKGYFTLNLAEDKTIELDAGGSGGNSGCLLYIDLNYGSVSLGVQWNDVDAGGVQHTYKIGLDRRIGSVQLYKDDTPQIGCGVGNSIMVKVAGNVTVKHDGYASQCACVLDNLVVPISNSPIDTTDKSSMYVHFRYCLEQSTPITMADGTTKAVCDLKVGDKVLSLNPYTLQLEEDDISCCDGGTLKMHNRMDVWNFSDGTTLKTIMPHQFFNTRTNKMEYIADFQIGDGVRKQDGTTTTLIGHETQKGVFFHNTLYTKKYNNYFANGILTGNRHSVKWGWYWNEQNGN